MAIKKGLGKGLDSMIPSNNMMKNLSEQENTNVSRETFVHINEIEPNKDQPRKNFNEDALQELADSIKIYGIIQPLILQKKEDYYEIIAGERRWRAARLAGIREVPAIIKEYSDKEVLEIALIENIQRENLNPIEEALAYKKLIVEFELKQDELAERVSKSRTTITNSMRLLKLDKRVMEMLIDGLLTTGHARALLAIEDGDKQCNTASLIFDENLSVRETEKLIKKIVEEKVKEKTNIEIENTDDNDLIYRDIEERIKKIMGTKVQILKKKKNKGKIEIEYYSNEELERILDMFESIS